MPVHNADIAAVFDEIADLLEIEGANLFRIRACRNAARTLRDLPGEVVGMVAKGEDLTELPGIGKDLSAKIKEIVKTGTAAMLDEHRKTVPARLTELLRIPGHGAYHPSCAFAWLLSRSGCATDPSRHDGCALPDGKRG